MIPFDFGSVLSVVLGLMILVFVAWKKGVNREPINMVWGRLVLVGATLVVLPVAFVLDATFFPVSNLPTQTPETAGTVDTGDWPTYTNEESGFSLKYPRFASRGETAFVAEKNVVFVTIASSTLFERKAELQLPTRNDILSKAKEIVGEPGIPWAISFYDVSSEADLNDVIQERLGDGCKLGLITPSEQDGTFDVGIDPVTPGEQWTHDFDSSCWINYMLAFKYSPSSHRAAIWDIGQEGKFPICDANKCTDADTLMADSFRFIPRKN